MIDFTSGRLISRKYYENYIFEQVLFLIFIVSMHNNETVYFSNKPNISELQNIYINFYYQYSIEHEKSGSDSKIKKSKFKNFTDVKLKFQHTSENNDKTENNSK